MTPRPSRETTAGRAYLNLQRLARESDRPTDEVFLRYVLERFLYRLSRSSYADRLVLKGGMLLETLDIRRPTRDIDLAALRLADDLDVVREMIKEVAAIEINDGVTFDIGRLDLEPIREADVYGGVRVRMPAGLDRARVTLAIDISFGEVVTPGPHNVRFPALLHEQGFELLGYPLVTVVAEKIETMVRRGPVNTRDRDFLDLWLILRRHPIGADEMRTALTATARQRGTALRPLGEAVGDLPERRQDAWTRYLQRTDLTDIAPANLAEAVSLVVEFADPLITGAVASEEWDPTVGAWIAG